MIQLYTNGMRPLDFFALAQPLSKLLATEPLILQEKSHKRRAAAVEFRCLPWLSELALLLLLLLVSLCVLVVCVSRVPGAVTIPS